MRTCRIVVYWDGQQSPRLGTACLHIGDPAVIEWCSSKGLACVVVYSDRVLLRQIKCQIWTPALLWCLWTHPRSWLW